ncbi:hypothetical protein E4U42_000044 [Claviceps africana]|uniref:Uncharacterized protein n=1 Tax=Claviceps africana TaxID=83212 RepID=A0A8K0NM68_9HYPO|nr:hypothetical protein E4U42_000044 [Claviceps africana]
MDGVVAGPAARSSSSSAGTSIGIGIGIGSGIGIGIGPWQEDAGGRRRDARDKASRRSRQERKMHSRWEPPASWCRRLLLLYLQQLGRRASILIADEGDTTMAPRRAGIVGPRPLSASAWAARLRLRLRAEWRVREGEERGLLSDGSRGRRRGRSRSRSLEAKRAVRRPVPVDDGAGEGAGDGVGDGVGDGGRRCGRRCERRCWRGLLEGCSRVDGGLLARIAGEDCWRGLLARVAGVADWRGVDWRDGGMRNRLSKRNGQEQGQVSLVPGRAEKRLGGKWARREKKKSTKRTKY